MTQHDNSVDRGTRNPLSAQTASTLMGLRAKRGRRPIDVLAKRLEQEDGEEWLARVLQAGPLREQQATVEQFLAGQLSLESLESIRNRSKSLMSSSETDARLAGVAGYFLCIAVGLRSFDKLLTTSGGDELADHLVEFAAAAPSSFAQVLGDAAGHRLVG